MKDSDSDRESDTPSEEKVIKILKVMKVKIKMMIVI